MGWRNKYRNRGLPKRYKGCRSKEEYQVFQALKRLVKGLKYEETKLSYTIPEQDKLYTPDFELPNGILLEYKGLFYPEDRVKLLRVRECNPLKEIRLMFSNSSHTLDERSATTYADWCIANRFLCCGKSIPKAWLKEKVKPVFIAPKGVRIKGLRRRTTSTKRYVYLLVIHTPKTVKEINEMLRTIKPYKYIIIAEGVSPIWNRKLPPIDHAYKYGSYRYMSNKQVTTKEQKGLEDFLSRLQE